MTGIWNLIEQRAKTAGERPAFLAPDREPLTYAALADQTARFCAWLRSGGIGPQDRVAVVMPNGPEMAAAFVATAASAICAPLNPRFTQQEFEYYLKDLKPALLLLSRDAPPDAGRAARCLGIAASALASGARAGEFALPAGPACQEWPEAAGAALLLHTSGTTARPKLVPLSGANLAASAENIAASLALTPTDRCLNIMPLFHIHGLMAAVVATLQAGASVVCTDGVYAGSFFQWMDRFRPTWYTAVPTMHQMILARASGAEDTVRRVRLRLLRSCSAPLAPRTFARLEETFGAPVIEAYGMTEACHQMTANPLPPGRRIAGSVGIRAGCEVAVMDESGSFLAAGERGEVVIRGPSVTSGYLDNAAANEAAFTRGWFRTGDQGYFNEEGYLFLTGRLKELINRGGEKVSPREIDEVLLAHPAVRQAVAFAIGHKQLGEEIGAAIELAAGALVSEEELRRWAAGKLPASKAPRIVRIVDAIPKGPTGKLQRSGLAQKLGIEPLDDSVLGAYEAPRTPVERRIAALWQDLMPGARCGVRDRFEALGGDSLLAVRMLAALSESEGIEVPPAQFLVETTIAALAEIVEEERQARSGLLEPVQRGENRPPLLLFPGHDNASVGMVTLAASLDPALPVYAVNLDRLAPAHSLAQAAACCAQALGAQLAGQPVHLAGVCLGGYLAVETARCLLASGGKVLSLTLIDAVNPSWRRHAGGVAAAAACFRQWRHKLRCHTRALWSMPPRRIAPYLGGRIRDLIRYHQERLAARGGLGRTGSALRLRWGLDYDPEPLKLAAVVVRLRGRRLDAPALGWEGIFLDGLEVVDMPLHPNGALARENRPILAGILDRRVADR